MSNYELTGPARDRLDREDAEAFRRLPNTLQTLARQGDIGAVARLLAIFEETGGGGKSNSYLAGRRALAMELADRGLLTRDKLATELLLLLPESFVKFYEDLFHKAYTGAGGESAMHGRSGGLEKAKGQRGMTLGSEVGLQAKPGGKRWKNTSGMGVRSERAARVKDQVDQGLQALAREARDALAPSSDGENGGQGRSRKCTGEKCGRFLKSGWRFCPNCGTPAGRDTQESRRAG